LPWLVYFFFAVFFAAFFAGAFLAAFFVAILPILPSDKTLLCNTLRCS
jgi:hypothetical protein